MAFQSSAFQVDAFQQTDAPVPPPADESVVHWFPFEAALNSRLDPEQIAEQVRQERIRLGILPKPPTPPAAAVQAVARVAYKLDPVEYRALLAVEMKAIGEVMKAIHTKQLERAIAKKRADDDDEEAIGLLI
jgi:hypothetical protein